jgi:hypothetical protein
MFTLDEPHTQQLIATLRANPDGSTFMDIAVSMNPIVPQRTLQRWLSKLVASGQIKRRGGSKNTRYFVGNGRHTLPAKKRKPKPVVAKPPPPLPAPAPEEPNLPPEYRPLFDRIAPKIIRLGFVDTDAGSELAMAACREWRNASPDTVNAFVFAAQDAFDGLDRNFALAKYDITPDQWSNWRHEWCLARDLPTDG